MATKRQEKTVTTGSTVEQAVVEKKTTKKEDTASKTTIQTAIAATKKEKAPTVLLAPRQSGEYSVTLAELVDIKNTTIPKEVPDANIIQRSLKEANLYSLLKTPLDKLPAIQIQESTDGCIILDGYHRVEIFRISARILFHNPRQGEDFDEIKYEAGLPEMSDEEAVFVGSQTIKVVGNNFKDFENLVDVALEYNTRHGLPAAGNFRSQYVLHLLERAKKQGKKLTQRQACKQVGVSPAAVTLYRQAQEKKRLNALKVAGKLDAETTEKMEQQEILTKSSDALKKFAVSLKTLYSSLEEESEEFIIGYLRDQFADEDLNAVTFMSDMLASLALTLNGPQEKQ